VSDAGERVIAVIVSHDRLGLLARCLRAVAAQSIRPYAVVVIDNASSDGTWDWLKQASLADPRLRPMRSRINGGGAGGFHVGMRVAMARGADWIWLMDDDGQPQVTTLELQLAHARRHRLDLCGPLVLDDEDPSRLAFGLKKRWTVAGILALEQDGLVWGETAPFNGTLVRGTLVGRIGSVEPRFFLWGDEVDYQLRALHAGARVATVVPARYLHPRRDRDRQPVLDGLLGEIAVRPPSMAARYWRNLGVLDRTHRWARSPSKTWIQHAAWLLVRRRPQWREWWRFTRAYRAGRRCGWPRPGGAAPGRTF
jgi:rhamnopyranosyl-N-acetylglucosaminyl-diphospho-decaprenol beta-1,3/1,4-galactofuranosyltransferase